MKSLRFNKDKLMKESEISLVYAFCRKYDLVFMEVSQKQQKETLRFIDFNHDIRSFTLDEIQAKLLQ